MKDDSRKKSGRIPGRRSGTGDCIDLFLYVTDQTPPCLTAFANLKCICDEHLEGRCRITVIDLEKSPDLARTEGILAIPTLVRDLPGRGKRKVIGTLDDGNKVLSLLGLIPGNGHPGSAMPMGGR